MRPTALGGPRARDRIQKNRAPVGLVFTPAVARIVEITFVVAPNARTVIHIRRDDRLSRAEGIIDIRRMRRPSLGVSDVIIWTTLLIAERSRRHSAATCTRFSDVAMHRLTNINAGRNDLVFTHFGNLSLLTASADTPGGAVRNVGFLVIRALGPLMRVHDIRTAIGDGAIGTYSNTLVVNNLMLVSTTCLEK